MPILDDAGEAAWDSCEAASVDLIKTTDGGCHMTSAARPSDGAQGTCVGVTTPLYPR